MLELPPSHQALFADVTSSSHGTPEALVLFSHGSLLCGAGRTLERHAQRLRKEGHYAHVRVGYLNYSSPLFAEVVDELQQQGIRSIIVVPYFLVSGHFVSRELHGAVAEAAARFPRLEIRLAEPMLDAPELADAILQSASVARPLTEATSVSTIPPGECQRHPRCPLYGTAACPAGLAP